MIAYAFGNLMHRLRQGNLIHCISDGRYEESKNMNPIEVSADEFTVSSPKVLQNFQQKVFYFPSREIQKGRGYFFFFEKPSSALNEIELRDFSHW